MKPKYQVISDDLKSKILSGEYKIDEKIPTELTLQNKYQVSRHTIRKSISELSNKGFLKSEKGSGTYVSRQYRSKNNTISNSKTIGVITTYISDYIFPSIIRGIEQRLNEDNYSLLLASTNNDVKQEKKALEMMLSNGVKGLIVEPTKSNLYNPNIAYYLSFKEHNIPFVMINASYEELDVPFLCLDDIQSGYLATKELIDNGHKNIGLISKMDDLQGKYRMKGYINALEKEGLKFQSENIFTYSTSTKARMFTDLKKFITHVRKSVTAIVCYNDEIGLEVVNVCNDLKISIPDQISIIGQDNSYISQNANIKLTTLTHPQEVMGRDAANWIIEKIRGIKELPYEKYYQPNLIKGETVTKL